MPVDVWDAIAAAANARAVPVHLDGARLWHAAAAQHLPPARVARAATSIMVSLSKGLGCPVGSCLAGTHALIDRAREARRRFGGAMRQSGILGAAGLYALEHNLDRLGDDHAKARLLADRLQGLQGLTPLLPDTNIVMLDLTDADASADDAVARLADAGVLVVPFGPKRLRAVTHLDVSTDDVAWAAHVITEVVAR
jgi:threonine aldolase